MTSTTNTQPEPTAPPELLTAQELEDFRAAHNVSLDWHEPDNQGVGAQLHGAYLDNAFPVRNETTGEFFIALVEDDEPVAVINIANLLSWGSQAGRHPEPTESPMSHQLFNQALSMCRGLMADGPDLQEGYSRENAILATIDYLSLNDAQAEQLTQIVKENF